MATDWSLQDFIYGLKTLEDDEKEHCFSVLDGEGFSAPSKREPFLALNDAELQAVGIRRMATRKALRLAMGEPLVGTRVRVPKGPVALPSNEYLQSGFIRLARSRPALTPPYLAHVGMKNLRVPRVHRHPAVCIWTCNTLPSLCASFHFEPSNAVDQDNSVNGLPAYFTYYCQSALSAVLCSGAGLSLACSAGYFDCSYFAPLHLPIQVATPTRWTRTASSSATWVSPRVHGVLGMCVEGLVGTGIGAAAGSRMGRRTRALLQAVCCRDGAPRTNWGRGEGAVTCLAAG